MKAANDAHKRSWVRVRLRAMVEMAKLHVWMPNSMGRKPMNLIDREVNAMMRMERNKARVTSS